MSEVGTQLFKDKVKAEVKVEVKKPSDQGFGTFAQFSLKATSVGSAVGFILNPISDISHITAFDGHYYFDAQKLGSGAKRIFDGELTLNAKEKKLTLTFYTPADGELVAAFVAHDIPGGDKLTSYTRIASFTWNKAE